MKAMKKSITLALALVMLLSCVVFPASAASYPFTDVPAGAWYSEHVQYVYENGLMNGTSATTFSPETKMDRAMLVTVLYRMDGSKSVSGSMPFADIKTDGYYYTALLWAYQNGIINGTSATQFSPSMSITREMMVTIFYRYAQYIDRDVSRLDGLSGYTDAGSISSYAKTPFQWAVANGIIFGVSSTALSPEGTATRAQCAAILKRFCEWSDANAGEDTDPTEPTEHIHKHSYTGKVTKAATCIEDGVKTYVCECGDVDRTEAIPKTGHSYSVTSEKAGTCCEAGFKTYTCSKCSDSYTESTGTTEHSWVHHHTDEVGHEEGYYVCHCGGWSGTDLESFAEHAIASGKPSEHAYYSTSRWVVDTPASDYYKCSVCGATK